MAIYHAQIGFQINSTLPKDVNTINPHYQGTDPVALANQLKTNILANTTFTTTPCAFTIKVYLATGGKPHYPLATATGSSGTAATQIPSEVALCLSYYSGFNQPRLRGRLYIPNPFILGASGLPGQRPSTTFQNNAMTWGPTLFKGLPAGTTACVFSRVAGTASDITNYYVDNEWDIVRSRGLAPTSRVTGTVP